MKVIILILLIVLSGCLFQAPKGCDKVLVYNSNNEDCRSVCKENFKNWETNYKVVVKCPAQMVLDECTCECIKKGQTIKELYYQAHGAYPECGKDCSEEDITKKDCELMGT